MSSVYVIQQQARLRVRNRRLQVERDEEGREPEVLLSVPLGRFRRWCCLATSA